ARICRTESVSGPPRVRRASTGIFGTRVPTREFGSTEDDGLGVSGVATLREVVVLAVGRSASGVAGTARSTSEAGRGARTAAVVATIASPMHAAETRRG